MSQKTASAIQKLFLVLQTAESELPAMRSQIHEAYASLNVLSEALGTVEKQIFYATARMNTPRQVSFLSDPPPLSEVSVWTGIAGLLGLAAALLLVFGIQKNLHIASKSLEVLALTALPMIVHEAWRVGAVRNFFQALHEGAKKRSVREQIRTAALRLLGVLAILIPIAAPLYIYPHYLPTRQMFLDFSLRLLLPYLGVAALVYWTVVTLLGAHTRDFYFQLGEFLLGRRPWRGITEKEEYFRRVGLKLFYIPFMFGILYGNVNLLQTELGKPVLNVFRVVALAHAFLYVTDVVFGLIGYLANSKSLGSNIRSTQGEVSGWVVALICYPPFVTTLYLFGDFQRSLTWSGWTWLTAHGPLLWLWAGLIIACEIVYVSATVIFGLRFSNLTNRGIITNGPYRYLKHPAYFSKNLSWWLIYVPFIPKLTWQIALLNTAQLILLNSVYYMRARTEERHLREDERYREYEKWIAVHGVLPSLGRGIRKAERRAARFLAGKLG